LSSSGPGSGQVRVRSGSGRSDSGKVQLRELKTQRFGPEPYNKFGFHHHHKLFLGLLRGLDMSCEPKEPMDRGSLDFKVDFKEDIKRDYRGDIREFFREYLKESIFLAFKGSRQVRWA